MRAIDADVLKASFEEDGHLSGYIEEYIDYAPTLDLAPVVHGAIVESNENGKCKRVFSCCGTDFTQLTMWMIPKYCPNCGAKMDGGMTDANRC